jgi:hypothetical protein
MSELPYKTCYAVIEAKVDGDTFIINTWIRNSEHGEFSSNFELISRFYISSRFDNPYGGGLEVTSYQLNLSTLKSATKVLSAAYKKLDKISNQFGYVKSATENIMRQLLASGVKEVRIAPFNERFNGWNCYDALDTKTDLSSIRFKLEELETAGRKYFPYTGEN